MDDEMMSRQDGAAPEDAAEMAAQRPAGPDPMISSSSSLI